MQQYPGTSPALHAIVLAAGESRRFGTLKQLAPIAGQSLLGLAAGRAVELCGSAVTIVLGARAAELAPLLRDLPVSVTVNPLWREGLGSSIRAGVASLPESCEGVLLMLADQAAVSTGDLRRLADAWRGQPRCIVAASRGAIVGAPAVFPRALFHALGELRGNRGAHELIERHRECVMCVDMPHAAIDIDTPADLHAFAPSEPPS